MRLHKFTLLIFTIGCLLVGGAQRALAEELTSQERDDIAKQVFSQLAAKDYAAIEKQLDSSIQLPDIRDTLEKMASFFPAEVPKSVAPIMSRISTTNGLATYSMEIEYQYSKSALLCDIAFKRLDGQIKLLSLYVKPRSQSQKELNRFSFESKGPLHYVVFAFAVTIPLFIVYALVRCFMTPIAKRKWLWLLFIAIGITPLSFNWTDGSFSVQPIGFMLLGSGYLQVGSYAPFIITISIPLGAIVFLMKRRSLIVRSDDQA